MQSITIKCANNIFVHEILSCNFRYAFKEGISVIECDENQIEIVNYLISKVKCPPQTVQHQESIEDKQFILCMYNFLYRYFKEQFAFLLLRMQGCCRDTLKECPDFDSLNNEEYEIWVRYTFHPFFWYKMIGTEMYKMIDDIINNKDTSQYNIEEIIKVKYIIPTGRIHLDYIINNLVQCRY